MSRRPCSRTAPFVLTALAMVLGFGPRGVHAGTEPPVFTSVVVTPTSLVAGQRLTGSAAAADPGGAAATLTWDFGDGSSTVAGPTAQHIYGTPGLYTLTLAAAIGAGPVATQSFTVVVHPSAKAVVPAATLSTRAAIPFEYVAILGAFEPGVPTVVTFRFGKVGLVVTPTLVMADRVRVAAPLLPRGATLSGGNAVVTVVQGRGAAARFVNAGKVKIGKPPRVALPPGEVTRSFVRVAQGVLIDAYETVQGSDLDTPERADEIASMLAFLDAMSANIARATAPKAASAPAPAAGSALAAAAAPSDYEIAFSATTVQQFDSFFAGAIAASSRNTADPQMRDAFQSWANAGQLARGESFDLAHLEAMMAAEQNLRDTVRQDATALVEGLNTMMAPLSSTVATLQLQSLASGNPATVAVAAQLAVCTDAISVGLVLGLLLDAAYADLTQDPVAYQTYLAAARKMEYDLLTESLTAEVLGNVARLAGGPVFAEWFGALRNTGNSLGLEIMTFQNLVQPLVPADASISVADVTAFEGHSGSRDFVFTVQLSTPSASRVTVKCATADGSATAGSDYDAVRAITVSFLPGQTNATFAVRVRGDRTREPNETFAVNLSGAVGAPIARGRATGTIVNDDVSRLTASSGSNDYLGTVTGCGRSTALYLDGAVHVDVRDVGPGGSTTATVWGYTYCAEYGGSFYEWEGPLTWVGETLAGTLTRTDNPARPPVAMVITQSDGQYLLTASVPFTYYIYLLDGSCTGPVNTFTHQANGLVMQAE